MSARTRSRPRARPCAPANRNECAQKASPAVPAPPEAVPDTVSTLCVAGDLVMHIPIINSCRTDDGYDFTGLFDDLK